MDKVRVLIFDDDPEQLVEVQFALEQTWEKFRWTNGAALPSLAITAIETRNEIRSVLGPSNLQDSFDFFLCDIYVGKAPAGRVKQGERRPEPEGFRSLKMAKEHGLPLCFAITTGDHGHEAYQKAFNEFESYVDDHFLKAELRGVHQDQRPIEVITKIAMLLRSKGLIRNLESELHFDTSIQEARTLGIIEEVGESTLSALAGEVAMLGATGVKVSSLSPGLSGAKVLKLVFSGSQENFSTRPILLKVSRDRGALKKEHENYRVHVKDPARGLARAIATPRNLESGILESNGWYAISFDCAEPAMSLIDWLTQASPPAPSDVGSLLEGLYFEDGLADAYATTNRANTTVLQGVEDGLMTAYRRMAILESIRDFQPLLAKHVKGKFSHLDELKVFIEHGRLLQIESSDLSKRPTSSCIAHGDLHGRNLLVARRHSRVAAVLIDLASMRNSIWTVDLVRLVCDVFLSGWDRGIQSLEWSGLKSWVGQLGLLAREGRAATLPNSVGGNIGVKAAVDWIFDNRFRVSSLADEPYHRAEFSLSLGVEFARASYRDRDMTAPKRAFALVCANALLKEASDLFKTRPAQLRH